MIAVNINQLSKKYGRRIGITGIDLAINEGEIFGLVGPDGAGKSTILRILMNFIVPSDGEAEIFDMDVVDEAKKIKKETAYVPGEVYFYHKMRAGKYINLVMKAHHHKKDEYFKRVMTAFDVDPKERFEDMDRSDQKKMALAAAIAAEPKLLLLDEPLRGLDGAVQNCLFDHLQELQENGTTILISCRDADEIASICTRIAVIENGEITMTPEEFAAQNPGFREREFFMEDEEEAAPEAEADQLEKTIVIAPAEEAAEETPAEEVTEAEEATEEVPAEEAAEAPAEEAAEAKEEEKEKTAEIVKETKPAEKEAPAVNAEAKPQKEFKNITMRSIGFKREAFEEIGAEIVSEKDGKIILEYSGDLNVLAKLLYDLNMDDIQLSSKDLQEVFMPFYEGGENE